MSEQLRNTVPVSNKGHRPFTVLLLIPEHMRDEEACEADWVRRLWTVSPNRNTAITDARDQCAALFGWDEDDDMGIEKVEQLAPLAIYPGHQYDELEPEA